MAKDEEEMARGPVRTVVMVYQDEPSSPDSDDKFLLEPRFLAKLRRGGFEETEASWETESSA